MSSISFQNGLELCPEYWAEFRFDAGKTGFDFSNREAKP